MVYPYNINILRYGCVKTDFVLRSKYNPIANFCVIFIFITQNCVIHIININACLLRFQLSKQKLCSELSTKNVL